MTPAALRVRVDKESYEVTRLSGVRLRLVEAWCAQPNDCVDVLCF